MLLNSEIVLELPPIDGNPRNSEGAFIDLKDGIILFAYSKFIGNDFEDHAPASIACCYSSDDGSTWSKEQIIITPEDDNAMNVMSVSFLRMKNGDIGLFYVIRRGWDDTRLHLRRSADEGKSWGSPTCCIPSHGYFVTNNDRVVRLSNGRIIVPVSFHRTPEFRNFDSRGTACWFYSDDDGKTWKESRSFYSIPVPVSHSGLQEPGLIELKNGVLWSWARTDMGSQYEMYSIDKGESWTLPSPSKFYSPGSPLSIKRNPENGNLLAIWNLISSKGAKEWPRDLYRVTRTPLVVSVSVDDGVTWGKCKIIEDDINSGYCYTAIHFIKDAVLLAYCAGGKEDGSCLTRLRVKRVQLNDLIKMYSVLSHNVGDKYN